MFHVGAPLELSCRVERAHELTYALWYHNSGSLLGLTCGLTGTARVDRVRVSSEQLALRPPANSTAPAAPDGCSAQQLEAMQRFQLHAALPTDAAVYKCVLWNRFGCVATRTCAILERAFLWIPYTELRELIFVTKTSHLCCYKIGEPLQPLRPAILAVSSIAVLVGVSSPPKETLQVVYRVDAREEPPQERASGAVSRWTARVFTRDDQALVTGLAPHTLYRFRVRAICVFDRALVSAFSIASVSVLTAMSARTSCSSTLFRRLQNCN